MTSTINQKAYLQKYLAGPSGTKKKKKKKPIKGDGFKIIDDDIDVSKLRPLDGDELDILDMGEDAPQIAGIIDERPDDVKKEEQFKKSSKWKVVNQDDGFNSKLQIEEIQKDVKQTEQENTLIFGKMYSDTEDEKNSGSDLSPPRKQDNNQKTKKTDSSKIKHKESSAHSSDKSPPRKMDNKPQERIRKKPSRWDHFEKSTDTSPSRSDKLDQRYSQRSKSQRGQDWDSDVSPPRKSNHESYRNIASNSDHSPQRKSKKDSERNKTYDSDLSPPRKMDSQRNNACDSDISPPRKSHKNFSRNKPYNSDLSPPRKSLKDSNRNKAYDSDHSPPRKSKKDSHRNKAYDSDLSPPRKLSKDSHRRKLHESVVSRSLKHNSERSRKTAYDSDLSPPRKHSRSRKSPSPQRNHRKFPTDQKRKYNSDSDASPPRRQKVSEGDVRYKRSSNSPPPTNKKMAKTLEGKRAGLQDAKQLRHENEDFRKKEEEVFSRMTDEVSGRNAQVVSRKGKRETSEDRRKQRDKADKQKELDEKYKKWSKGVKQLEAEEARMQDFMHEASKPLARHKDDRDLESRLKQVERDGDPMMQYMREKKKETGELLPEKPIYKGNFPPNRFNLRPGYRWDGVDRSNGYEKKHFDHQSKKKAQEEEVYKWSTEDL